MTNKVLIIEDDQIISKVYALKFKKSGFVVDTAKNGSEGIKKTLQMKPDIIILDLVMPIKDGFETMKDLQDNKLTKKIPVIVSSCLGSQKDIDTLMNLGAKKYMVKTEITFVDLLSEIKKQLNQE